MQRELSEQTRTLVRERIPNYGALDPTAAALAAIKVIAADFYIYCERNLMIKDKRGRMVPLVPNWAQRKLVESVLDDLVHGRPVRYIILKARQMGLSTIIEALCYWWTTTHKNINSVIIAHEKNAATNLYKMFRRYYEYTHPQFRVDRKYNTKQELTFDVEDKVKQEYESRNENSPGLASEIKTMVARDGGGRSDTILFFHGSEVAFWDAGADVLSSALQAVPMLADTFAFLESTANGVGGYFYNEWQSAKKGESTFKPFFFAWHEHPEYMLDGTIEVYDEEEKELLEIFADKDYPRDEWDRKLIWRREKKKEFHADPSKFYQEYPKDDVEAFIASGRPVFDMRALMKMEERAIMAEKSTKFANLVRRKKTWDLQLVPKTMDGHNPTPLKLWEMPKEGITYTVGVDVAEGIEKTAADEGGDYSVIDIMRIDNLKTVARWRGRIDPDELGEIVVGLATLYNFALIGPEINNHGLTTTQKIRNMHYRNLYMRETSEDDQFQERTTKMGWKTDRKTKPLMINDLVKAIREGDIIDLDVVFIRECMTYARDDAGHTNAQEGMYDDCVVAKAINLQMADWNSYNTDNLKKKISKPITRNGNNATSDSFPTLVETSKLPFRRRKGYGRRAGRELSRQRHR